jgi:recombination endonuclease VII
MPRGIYIHVLSNIDEITRTATCATCGMVDLNRQGIATNGTTRWACATGKRTGNRNRRLVYKEKKRQRRAEKLILQDSKCSICDGYLEFDSSYMDHDHATDCLRDVLCPMCNAGLGQFKDSPELLRKAAAYIEIHSGNTKNCEKYNDYVEGRLS